MAEIPIWFEYTKHNFEHFFKKNNYFKNAKIKILHLGAYTGHGTRWMLEHSNGACVDVDPWMWPIYEPDSFDHKAFEVFYEPDVIEKIYDEQTLGLPATKFKGTTKEFFAQNKKTFDFIYVDASHRKSDVEYDLAESWKVLNPNGVIACDDYIWHLKSGNPELIPHYAINEFVEKHANEIEVLIKNSQLWFKKL
jgi:predicted O-methyltransferase YrrM